MSRAKNAHLSRRDFVKSAAAATAAVALPALVQTKSIAAPPVATESKTDTRIILGEGDHRYEVTHDWVKPPSPFEWQTTHNVTIDRDGNIYIIHEGKEDQRDHPAIFVFDRDGQYVR